MSRDEYIAWVKKRALGWLEAGNSQIALLTFQQDLDARPDLDVAWYAEKGHTIFHWGLLETPEQIREYIEGLT